MQQSLRLSKHYNLENFKSLLRKFGFEQLFQDLIAVSGLPVRHQVHYDNPQRMRYGDITFIEKWYNLEDFFSITHSQFVSRILIFN